MQLADRRRLGGSRREQSARAIRTSTFDSPFGERISLRKMRASAPFGRCEPPRRRRSYCIVPDQVIHQPAPERQRRLGLHARRLVRRSLELIRDHSTLDVRSLTRSPLARADFDLFQSFGPRLLFGMSAHVAQRSRQCLRAARAAGLHVYVASRPRWRNRRSPPRHRRERWG